MLQSFILFWGVVALHQRGWGLRITNIKRKNIMDEKNLFEKIMLRIRAEEKAMAIKRKIAMFSIVTGFSFIGLIPAIKMAYSGFVESGFIQLFSLLITDTSTVMGFLGNFTLSLLETLPMNAILITGFLTVMFFGSIFQISRQKRPDLPRALGSVLGGGRVSGSF